MEGSSFEGIEYRGTLIPSPLNLYLSDHACPTPARGVAGVIMYHIMLRIFPDRAKIGEPTLSF
jgi:hypothetical protein